MKITVLIMLLSVIITSDVMALRNHHILRRVENLTREEIQQIEKVERLREKEIAIAIKKREEGNLEASFHIHDAIICRADKIGKPSAEMEVMRNRSRITLEDARSRSQILMLLFEVTKAHIETSRYFHLQGKRVETDNVRYHSIEELAFYDEEISSYAIDDMIKPAYYIEYVIGQLLIPIIEDVRSEEGIEIFYELLDGIKKNEFSNVHHEEYSKNINDIINFLNSIRNEKLETNNPYETNPKLMVYTLIRILKEIWQAYYNISYCPHYNMVLDPAIDPYEEDLPDFHDTYVLGYGLLKRAEFITKKLLYDFENNHVDESHLFYNTKNSDPELNEYDRNAIKEMFKALNIIFHNITMKKNISYSISNLKQKMRLAIKVIIRRSGVKQM